LQKKLTAKECAFIEEYLVDLNGTQAAIRAGYSAKSAAVIAHENLRKPKIALALDRAMAERYRVTRPRIVDELAKIAFSDICKVVTWRRETVPIESPNGEGEGGKVVLSRVTVTDSSQIDPDAAAAIAEMNQGANGSLRVKMHDKLAALEKLGRTLGIFKDRVEHSGPGGEPLKPMSELEIGRRLAFVLEMIARGEVKAKLPKDEKRPIAQRPGITNQSS
jgi:phage terminase small subunit